MKTLFYLVLFLFFIPLNAQTKNDIILLEDGKRPQMSRWTVDGPATGNSGIDYIAGDKGRGSVIKLKGLGLHSSFTFRGEKGFPLSVSPKNVLQWKMKYKEPFIVEIGISTSDGIKHVLYSDLDEKINNNDLYLHIGLGTRFNDGNWHTVTRDVQEDLKSMVPNVKIKSIDFISFKGSGYIDDIKAMDKKPVDVIVSSTSLGSKHWDKLGKKGTFSVDYDVTLGDVFKFDSGEKKTVFQLKQTSGEWDLTLTPIVQWKMKMLADYKIYFIVESTAGKYILVYDDDNQSKLYDPKTKMIHYGLGYYSVDNQWHVITRDLNEDLKKVFPNADPIKISGVLLRGKGSLSEIKLIADNPVDSETIKGWEVYDNDPKGAVVRPLNDLEKGEVVELSGESLKNGYRYSGKNGTLYESTGKPFVKWEMYFREIFDLMLAVESDGVVRYIHYVSMPADYNRIKDNELYIGLGETNTDGRWHIITRDLSQDVKLLVKDAGYSACKYFLVRGSGRINKIEFFEKIPGVDKKATASASASLVIGQYSFGHNLKNLWDDGTAKNNALDAPYSTVVGDKGTIYVSDSANNRILIWNKLPDKYGSKADAVLKTGLNSPAGMFVDKRQLFVADTGNNRILIYDLPLDDESRPKVILASGLKSPKAVFSDGNKLFVADTGNNRVLIWNSIPSRNPREFDVVLGQASVSAFLANKGNPNPNYNTMNAPSGLYSDGISLYVSDTGNNRLLLFKEIPTMNGWHADVVIGQDGFKDSKPNRGQKATESSFKAPENIFISDGKLYVCDTGNNRVLFFNITEDLDAAEGVIGQTNFKTSGMNAPNGVPNSYTLFAPTSIFVKDGILYISDKGNNRVLIY